MAGLLEGDVTKLESTSASIASSLSLPFTQLAYAYSARGRHENMQRAVERAMQLSPNPAAGSAGRVADPRAGDGKASNRHPAPSISEHPQIN